MITGLNVINEEGQEVKVDVIMRFRVEELDKEMKERQQQLDNKKKK